MDAQSKEDFHTLPLILDSSDLQSIGFVNYNGFQLELSKNQSIPLVIFDNGNILNDSPTNITCGTLMQKDEVISDSQTQAASDSLVLNHNAEENELSSEKVNDTYNMVENVNDLIEKIVTYKCKLCSFKSSDKVSLSAHLKLVHYKTVKENEEASIVKDHKKNEHSEKMAFMCVKCSEAFGSFSDWRLHLASVHKVVMSVKSVLENTTLNDGPPLVLNKNESPLSRPREEKKKLIIVPKNDKKIACTIRSCLVRLSTHDLVKKHEECHAGPRHFSCPNCSQPFRKWSDCANHLWSSHSLDIDLYSCPTCDYKTALRTKYKNHIKIHSDEREFMCSECGKTFKQAVQLKNHYVSHLKAVGSPNIPNWSKKQECSQCKRSFYDGKSLKKHIQSVHSNLRPYVCQVCGHTSANKNRLGLHLRQHTGEKPFSCPLCNFTTGDQNCLRRHAWRHSHVRPYACPHCSYSCIQSNSLKNHIKAQHPGASGIFSCSYCPFTSLSQSSLESHTAKAHTSCTEDKEKLSEVHFPGGKNSETLTVAGQYSENSPVVMMDDESQNCFEVPVVDTGGFTIPAD